jgi:hypothetical protein
MSLKEKLLNIQAELKAPKGQYNSYGGFNYRSCEDILEAVKPLLSSNKCVLTLSDDITQIGERYYIRAAATLTDVEGDEHYTNVAYAREESTKKGMDGAQITGTASSYARKYALNGLFLIDDTKDADTDEHAKQTGAEPKQEKKATAKQIELIRSIATEQGKELDEEIVKAWSSKQASDFISKYKGVK